MWISRLIAKLLGGGKKEPAATPPAIATPPKAEKETTRTPLLKKKREPLFSVEVVSGAEAVEGLDSDGVWDEDDEVTWDDDADQEECDRFQAESEAIPFETWKRIRSLTEETNTLDSYRDAAAAFDLYLEATRLAPDAPQNASIREARQFSDVGGAAYSAWLCTEYMERPGAAEEAIREAKRASPNTAAQINGVLAAAKQHAREEEKREAERESMRKEVGTVAAEVDVEGHSSDALVAKAIESARKQGDWEPLQHEAKALAKKGASEAAWAFLRAALDMVTRARGNVGSVHETMGDVCKKEGRHRDAAEHYLLACVHAFDWPSKRVQDQVRISLKKAGMKERADAARDKLLRMAKQLPAEDLVERMEAMLSDSGVENG